MKRIIFISFLILFAVSSRAQQHTEQSPRLNVTGTLKVDYKKNEKGTPVRFVRISDDMQFVTIINDQQFFIPVKKASRLFELTPKNVDEFWFGEYINHNMLSHYKNKGYRHSLRGEIMDEANEYLRNLHGLFYVKEFTCNYLDSIFAHIAPRNLDKKRPERLKLMILKSPNPDVYMLGNGTLLITTGLLSVVNSADELISVMVSEIAHYVLDHQVINIGKERARVRNAKVWGIVLSSVALGVEALLFENSEYYVPGEVLLPATIISEIINDAAIRKLGMGYSNKQYFDADDIAVKFLEKNNMNPVALSSALYNIWAYYKIANDNYALSKKGGYGNVSERVTRLERPKSTVDTNFLVKMSEVTTFNAITQLENRNFEEAERFVGKKIHYGCATDDDYLMFVQANMGYTNSMEDSERNLDLIRRTKAMSDIPNLGLYKQEILLLLRLERRDEAIDAIKEYRTMITDFIQQAVDDDLNWANGELSWSNKMYRQTMSDMRK